PEVATVSVATVVTPAVPVRVYSFVPASKEPFHTTLTPPDVIPAGPVTANDSIVLSGSVNVIVPAYVAELAVSTGEPTVSGDPSGNPSSETDATASVIAGAWLMTTFCDAVSVLPTASVTVATTR